MGMPPFYHVITLKCRQIREMDRGNDSLPSGRNPRHIEPYRL